MCWDELGDHEQQECHVEEEEEEEEGDGGSKGAEKENGGEDEPTGEVEAECHLEVVRVLVGANDVEAGSQDDRIGDPETTVG